MGEPVRGQDVIVDIFLEGDVTETILAQSMTWNQMSTKSRQERCGERYEQPRIIYHGWEGELEFEEETPIIDDLIDAAENGYFEGKRIVRIDITGTSYYPHTGDSRTYLYPECVFSANRNIGGKNEEAKQSLSWSSARRIEVKE